jgi:CheY-like chemotaxis protein
MRPRIEVLLCEDDPSSARLVTLALERTGVHVTQVGEGKQALALLLQSLGSPLRLIDVVLLDWMLPGMEGPQIHAEVLKAASERGLEKESLPRFVGFTARAAGPDSETDFRPDAWLTKPFDLDALRALVSQLSGELPPVSGWRDPALREALKAYKADLEVWRSRLQHAVSAGALSEVQTVAHSLAGNAPTYGFDLLGQAASELEKALEERIPLADLQDRVAALLEQLLRAQETLSFDGGSALSG